MTITLARVRLHFLAYPRMNHADTLVNGQLYWTVGSKKNLAQDLTV
jgi:hypothetical protein